VARFPIQAGSFGDLFATALWELGTGFSTTAVLASLQELFPGTTDVSSQIALNLAAQAQRAALGIRGQTPIPFGSAPPLPTIAGIEGGFYYDVTCQFWDESTSSMESRLVRVQSASPMTNTEIAGAAFDQALYYQQVTGSERFLSLDLSAPYGGRRPSCTVTAAYQGIG
jgi:hypothetical protein